MKLAKYIFLIIIAQFFFSTQAFSKAKPIKKEKNAYELNVPFKNPQTLKHSNTNSDVLIGIELISRKESRRLFAYTLVRPGLTPVEVHIKNIGSQSIYLQTQDSFVQTEKKTIPVAEQGKAVAIAVKKVSKLFNNLGYSIYELGNMFFTRIDYVIRNFDKKVLGNIILKPNQSARGIVFFEGGVKLEEEQVLTVPYRVLDYSLPGKIKVQLK